MNKLRSLNKKQIIIMSIVAVIVIALIVVGIIVLNGGKDDKKIDIKEVSAEVSKQIEEADLSEEEKAEVEKIEAAMGSELAEAKSEEEKQEILKKYNDKISTATGGKVTVPTNPAKPSGSGNGDNTSSGNTDKETSSSGDKTPSTDNKDDSKPSGGGDSSSSGSSGNTGSGTTKPSEPETPAEPEPTEPEKPAEHVHTVTVGNTGKWFDSIAEAEACYDAEVAKWEAKFLSGQITYEELGRDCPSHWEWKQCMCGKVTLSWWSEGTESK